VNETKPLQHLYNTKEIRSYMKNQKPYLIWLTGISCTGKTTIANELDKKLYGIGKHTYHLDDDNIRNISNI